MINLFKNKYKEQSKFFISKLFSHVDSTYKHFIRISLQTLVDCGLSTEETQLFLSHPSLKEVYLLGICAEELLPIRNTIGEGEGKKFEKSIINNLLSGCGSETGRAIIKGITPVLTLMRNDPSHIRVRILELMLMSSNLERGTAFQTLCSHPLHLLKIDSTMMEGPCKHAGIAINILKNT